MKSRRLLITGLMSLFTLLSLLQVYAESSGDSLHIVSADVTCITFPPSADGYGDPLRGVEFDIEYSYQAGEGAYLWDRAFINDGGWLDKEEFITGSGSRTFASLSGLGPINYPYHYTLTLRLYSTNTNFDDLVNPVGTVLAEVVVEGDCTESSPAKPLNIPFDPHDGRIHPDAGAPFAAYCTKYGLQVYQIDAQSEGSLVITIAPDILAAEAPAENTLLDEVDGLRLYHLSTGQLQINAIQADGKEYVLTWNGCPATSSQVSTFGGT